MVFEDFPAARRWVSNCSRASFHCIVISLVGGLAYNVQACWPQLKEMSITWKAKLKKSNWHHERSQFGTQVRRIHYLWHKQMYLLCPVEGVEINA